MPQEGSELPRIQARMEDELKDGCTQGKRIKKRGWGLSLPTWCSRATSLHGFKSWG